MIAQPTDSDSGPISQRSAHAEQYYMQTKTNTNPSPNPNRYRRRCPDPNIGLQTLFRLKSSTRNNTRQ